MKRLCVAFFLSTATPGTLLAATPQERPPEAYSALLQCRSIRSEADRLTCFDSAIAKLEEATRNRQIVMVDREHIRRTKKSLFGLSLPDLDLFGKGDSADEIKSVEGVVASARTDGDSRWIVSLQDGAVWRQIDNRPLALGARRGTKVVVVRAALGAFTMRIGNQPGIKVRRVN